jgi:hypothetical protein
LICWVELSGVYQALKRWDGAEARRQMVTHVQYVIEKLKNLLL